MTITDPVFLFGAFTLINIWTFMLFGFDKLRAEAGAWRIAESTLLGWTFVGGSLGAYLARQVFRHKTRNSPFVRKLHRIALFHALTGAVVAGLLFP